MLCLIEFGEIVIDFLWITILKLIGWFKGLRQKRTQRPSAMPTVSERVEAHTNLGFQAEEADGDPTCLDRETLSEPGTPPPNYESLRVPPLDISDLDSDEESSVQDQNLA